MLLRTIRVRTDGTLIACPHCDNEELTSGNYCMICGSDLTKAKRQHEQTGQVAISREERGDDLQIHQSE